MAGTSRRTPPSPGGKALAFPTSLFKGAGVGSGLERAKHLKSLSKRQEGTTPGMIKDGVDVNILIDD